MTPPFPSQSPVSTPLETESQHTAASSPAIVARWSNILFTAGLGLIALLALAARVYVGSINFLDLDEWQHVFISAAPRLADLNFELNAEAHPALTYWILRLVLHLGHTFLIYRLPTIVTGMVSVVLVGLIGRQVCRSIVMALLTALAFALSSVAITLSTEVRSYEVASCFGLLGFWCFLRFIAPDGEIKWIIFSGASFCLALECEYSEILVVGACLVMVAGFVVFDPAFRRRYGKLLNFALIALSFALPLGLMLQMYLGPLRHQPIQGYLYSYYWEFTPGEGKLAFLNRNLANEWHWFCPVDIQARGTALFLSGVLLIAGTVLWIRRLREKAANRRELVPFPLLLLLTAELIILALRQSYPFGGLLRQQYFLAPFLTLACFSSADVIASMQRGLYRWGVPIVLAAAILLNARTTARTIIVYPGMVMNGADYDAFRSVFPHAPAIYLNHFTVIEFFESTASEPRRFVRRVNDSSVIDQFEMGRSSNRKAQLFYDKSRYIPDLRDPGFYRSIAACLEQSGVPELALFDVVPTNQDLAQPGESLERTIAEQAQAAGLSTTRIVVDEKRKSVFAGFRLR